MVIFWSSFHNPLSTKKTILETLNGWRNFCIFKTIWSNVTSKFKACVCIFWTACCLASCFPKHTGRKIKSTDRDISSHQSLVSQNPLPKYTVVSVTLWRQLERNAINLCTTSCVSSRGCGAFCEKIWVCELSFLKQLFFKKLLLQLYF